LAEHLIGKYPKQVNAHGGYYVTPLVAALAEKHFKIAELLLLRHGAGTTVNVPGRHKRIPLHSAASYGQIDVVRFLLKHNADVNSQDDYGWTALHFTIQNPDYPKGSERPRDTADITRLLLEQGADINARTHNGHTPLHIAVSWGYVAVARVLLEHGANVNEENNAGQTTFQLALGEGQNEMMKLLSEHRAKSSRR